jgi:hypothetical protein
MVNMAEYSIELAHEIRVREETGRESRLSDRPSHLRRRGRLGVLALLGNCGPNGKANPDLQTST